MSPLVRRKRKKISQDKFALVAKIVVMGTEQADAKLNQGRGRAQLAWMGGTVGQGHHDEAEKSPDGCS